jgi:hypothetical protein
VWQAFLRPWPALSGRAAKGYSDFSRLSRNGMNLSRDNGSYLAGFWRQYAGQLRAIFRLQMGAAAEDRDSREGRGSSGR